MNRSISLVLFLVACKGVSSDEEAELAYIGLDDGVLKSVNLGMLGYNLASSANIDDQTTDGEVSGTVTVGGQVDQGESDNKELRLIVTLEDYADEVDVDFDEDGEPDEIVFTYNTVDGEEPELDISLRNIPATGSGTLGTLEGTLAGTVVMDGDLEGDVVLDVDIAGEIEEDPEVAGDLLRVEGTTTIIGTATSDYGVYDIDITR